MDSAQKERRRGNRHRLNLPATATNGDGKTAVTITHYSVNGVGLKSETPLDVGGDYAIGCYDSLIPDDLKVKVVTRRDRPDGTFEVGAVIIHK